MKLPKKAFEDKDREKRVMRYILLIVVITALPSIYLAYNIVQKSIFENNAEIFIKNEFKFPNTHIITKTFKYEKGRPEINLLLLGDDLPKQTIDSLKNRLAKYKIADAQLYIRQGSTAKQEIDYSQIKESILEDVFAKQDANKKNKTAQTTDTTTTLQFPDLKNELTALFPGIKTYSLTKAIVNNIDSTRKDTSLIFVGSFVNKVPKSERKKLNDWLKIRLNADSIQIFTQRVSKMNLRKEKN